MNSVLTKFSEKLGFDVVRFAKFGIVGGSGIFVNMGGLWFFTEVVGLYYLISSVLAIALAMISNFIWNDLWTWRDRGEPGVRAYLTRMAKFILVSSIAAYIGNLGILWVLTHFFHVYYLISNLIGIAVGTILNYSVNNFWTFREEKAER
ncbi:MAG: GtrA family protein [candidate division KSB1 bacterium]|nr:GtrA family protein [candidate division KSB1 bacterium]